MGNPKIRIKTNEDIEKMREGGKILAQIINEIKNAVKVGITTKELDSLSRKLCRKYNVKPAFLGYMDYPAALCVTINDEIVHGIPGRRKVKQGDIVSLDMGIEHKGLITDHAITIPVGKVSRLAKKLIKTAEEAMYDGIKKAIAGNFTGDIGYAMQKVIEKNGFNVARELVGHGVGYRVHEPPQVPGYGKKRTGIQLKENMTLAIEAIVLEGSWEIFFNRKDHWTTRTKDGKLASLFEHTIVVGEKGADILTNF